MSTALLFLGLLVIVLWVLRLRLVRKISDDLMKVGSMKADLYYREYKAEYALALEELAKSTKKVDLEKIKSENKWLFSDDGEL